MKSSRVMRIVVGLLFVGLFAVNASATSIGSWAGSARGWGSDSSFSTIASLMASQGHVVDTNAVISEVSLDIYDVFVMAEPVYTPDAIGLGLLADFVSDGGILLLLADSGDLGLPGLNNISSGIGSSLQWSGSATSNGTIYGGNFATEGGDYNIVGQQINLTPGTAVVSGGTALINDYLRFEQIGLGFVFAFGDRLDHNYFVPSTSNTNGQLFLNIVEGADNSVPEPGTFVLLGSGLLALLRRRRIS